MELSHYLYAFNHIINHGEHKVGKYTLAPFTAWHDIDGYTCYIGYKDLTMSLYFHGKFSYDYQQSTTLDRFSKVINNSVKEWQLN